MRNGASCAYVYALAVLILLVPASGVSATTWTELNSGFPAAIAGAGGLAVDPTTPSTLYSWTRSRGHRSLFKSTDGAATWQVLRDVADVDWLVVDPKNSETLYAGTNSGSVVKSVNGGTSWSGLHGAPRWVDSVVIDPQNTDNLYALSYSVIKSTDGGVTWTPSNTGLPRPPYPLFLAIDPITPSTLYVTLENGGIFKSIDKGDSWFSIKEGIPNLGGVSLPLAIDPLNPSIMYVGSYPISGLSAGGARPDFGFGRISKSTDGGLTWNIIGEGIPTNARVISFVIDPASPSNVYATFEGVSPGVIKSTDRGETWSVLQTDIPFLNFAGSPVVLDPQSPSTLYFGYVDRGGIGSGGVSKSTDGGASWHRANEGRNFVDVRALTIHPSEAGVFYAAAGADGVFKSVDGGQNWTPLAAFQVPAWERTTTSPPFSAGPAITHSLIIDLLRPNILYTLTTRINGCHPRDSLLLKSTDEGSTWNDSGPPLSGCRFWSFGGRVPFVLDPSDTDTLYVGADFGDWNGENPALIKTSDGGANWGPPQAWGCCAGSALVVDPTDRNTLYGGSWSGVQKSIDGGGTWNVTGPGVGVSVLALDPFNPRTLYAGSDTGYGSFGGLFKSTDGGVNWFEINHGLANLIDTHAPVTALVVDPVRAQTLYAGTAGYGVFKSTDGGDNWTAINEGLMGQDVRSLALAPGGSLLYAITTHGVFSVEFQ